MGFGQKFIFNASWMMRESAVVPTLPVAVPIVERVLPNAPLAERHIRIGPLRVVEQVEELAPELEVDVFARRIG